MRHHLRIATASLCLVLCLGFLALWVVSHQLECFLTGRFPGIQGFSVTSYECRLSICVMADNGMSARAKWGLRIDRPNDLSVFMQGAPRAKRRAFGYSDTALAGLWTVWLPHWLRGLITGGLALLIKPKPRFKFSLCELIILTTVAAIVLGAVAALATAAKGQ